MNLRAHRLQVSLHAAERYRERIDPRVNRPTATAILARVPVRVHTFHGHVFDGYFSPAKTRAFLAIERALARRTQRILTVSDHVRDELLGDMQRSP